MAKLQASFDDEQAVGLQITREKILELVVGGLSQELEGVVGKVEAQGYFTLVGKSIGDRLYKIYLDSLGVEELSKKQLFSVLLSLSSHMENQLVISEDESSFEFSRTFAPLSGVQMDNRYLSMFACGVVGHITAQAIGHARVLLRDADEENPTKIRMQVFLNDLEGDGQVFYRVGPNG